jgi:RNA polymerase sigma factor (sigma-70 family)
VQPTGATQPRSGDAAVYDRYADRLERIVAARVHTAPENIEDACHFAWTKYLSLGSRIRSDTALGWLSTTAIRQAWKLDRRQRRSASLDELADQGALLVSQLPDPTERAEQRERIAEVALLSERQQRLVWLRAAGLSYTEMAAYTGDSARTVERQILRASRSMRERHDEPARPTRAPVRPVVWRGSSGRHPLDRVRDRPEMER